MADQATIFLGIGTNLGDRHDNIRKAVEQLAQSGITILKVATVIETAPQGGPPQGKYLNTVIKAQTTLSPQDLLARIKTIETQLGRVPTVRNGPRIIDIDILFYNQQTIHTPTLTVPHPRMRERDFVMRPLLEIEPGFCGSTYL